MKTKCITRAAAALCITAVMAINSGCATMDQATQKVGGVFGSKSDTTRSATGGAIIGCAGGAILGKLIGNGSDMLKGCAAGAVVGGVASVQIHKHLLAEAQKVRDEANQVPGVKATVETKTVQATNDQGQQESTLTLDRLELNLPASKVAAHSEDVVRVVVKAATLADQAKEPTTIEVRGTTPQRDWLDTQVRNTLSEKTTVKVVDVPAAAPELVISPVPAVK